MPNQVDYDEHYIEACFRAWYDAGCPQLKTPVGTVPVGSVGIVKVLPFAPDGRKPNIITVRGWMDKFAWRERADALDAQVSLKLDMESIKKRVAVLKDLAETGKKLKDKGIKYIIENENPFQDNPSAAVRAIGLGAEMEFKYAGAADRLALITQMSDKQIEKEILGLLGKEPNKDD